MWEGGEVCSEEVCGREGSRRPQEERGIFKFHRSLYSLSHFLGLFIPRLVQSQHSYASIPSPILGRQHCALLTQDLESCSKHPSSPSLYQQSLSFIHTRPTCHLQPKHFIFWCKLNNFGNQSNVSKALGEHSVCQQKLIFFSAKKDESFILFLYPTQPVCFSNILTSGLPEHCNNLKCLKEKLNFLRRHRRL